MYLYKIQDSKEENNEICLFETDLISKYNYPACIYFFWE